MASPSRMGRLRSTGDKARAWDDFATRVVDARAVWSVSSDDGPVGAEGLDGSAAQPYWSSLESARAMVHMSAPGGRVQVNIVEIPLAEYLGQHLPRLVEQQVLVGIDWGTDQRGWVVDPSAARSALLSLVHQRLN
jgi:hypothetical protein